MTNCSSPKGLCFGFSPILSLARWRRRYRRYRRRRYRGTYKSEFLAALSPSPFWPGYIINTSGYDFRKGQLIVP
jgi:hypothetical protein